MINERDISVRLRWAHGLRIVSLGAALASIALLLAAAMLPVRPLGAESGTAPINPIPTTTPPVLAPELLIGKLAGKTLIRPSLEIAAVKDDGAAEKLLKRLKLHGVTEVGGQMVAYVGVEKEGIRQVKEGDPILAFTVERIVSGRVSLSLRGVIVELGHF